MINSIAIDGPAGAGKSTIAKRIAKEKGFIYVDTGAMYRAMGLFYLRENVEVEFPEEIEKRLDEINVTIKYENGEQVVYLNGENVNGLIRTQEVGNMASAVSANPEVRKKMVALQQEMAKNQSVVMDGRDIGTVVLPDAVLKIYLTASSAVRAKRRYDEFLAKGAVCDLAELQAQIEERDYRDMHREASPLMQAEDAVVVDSSDMDIDQVVDAILGLCSERGL